MNSVNEILQTITYRDEQFQNSSSLGTVQEIFKDFTILPIKESKNGARRASIMLKNKLTGKVAEQVLVMSTSLTDLFRADKVTTDHIAGFPVFHGEKGFFVGLPSAGWVEVSSITVKEYKPQAVALEDLIA
jgi:hypothetical protein